MKKEEEIITFEATIPLIKSALIIDGSGGAQIKLEVPEVHIEAIKRLMDLRGEVLTVAIRK